MTRSNRVSRPRIPTTLVPHDAPALEPERDYEAVAFTNLDLTGQQAADVRFLGGAIVDSAQLVTLAPALAHHLGIIVRDDD